jgi:hypothetical protein
MVTVWIFFGSGDVNAGAEAFGAGAAAPTAGAPGADAPGGTEPGADELYDGATGIVETTRGPGTFAGSLISTGCSSCGTSFSLEPAPAA